MLLNCFLSFPPSDELAALGCRPSDTPSLPFLFRLLEGLHSPAIASTQWLMVETILELEQCMLQLLIQMPLQLTFFRWMTAATAAMHMHHQ